MQLRNLSINQRLVFSFVGVVLLAAALIAVVFTLVLVETMEKSSREKIAETSKVAIAQVDDIARGLEIYTDLIASDRTFGQVLSFDSTIGISRKIGEFTKMSQGDLVTFVPNPEQYIQIKDEIFVNFGKEDLIPQIKKSQEIRKLLEQSQTEGQKGWIAMGSDLYVFAMKPVQHFGSNMGVIFLARKAADSLAKEIASAAGTGIVLFDRDKIFGTSLARDPGAILSIPSQDRYAKNMEKNLLVEDYKISDVSYFSLFSPILDVNKKQIGTLALLVSTASIREAQNQTLLQVLVVAALATVLSALVGLFLARAISTPIQSITKGIKKIDESGDLGIRIPGKFGAEIGILATSFNGLLGRLQDAHEKLASSERRMKEELTMASTVQEMLFPQRVSKLQNLELASFIEASTETGGDWYGYAEGRTGQEISVMIGDVTGHGMPAALITAITNGYFKGVRETEDAVRLLLAQSGENKALEQAGEKVLAEVSRVQSGWSLSTAEMLKILNRILLESTGGSLLMTFLASVYDAGTRELRYANAGHNRPFICKPRGKGGVSTTILQSPPSQRLGEFLDVQFEENRIQLEKGEMVIWYTDGLLECENGNGQQYGKRRLFQQLGKVGNLSPEEVVKVVINDAYEFYGDTPRKDDITMVVGKVE